MTQKANDSAFVLALLLWKRLLVKATWPVNIPRRVTVAIAHGAVDSRMSQELLHHLVFLEGFELIPHGQVQRSIATLQQARVHVETLVEVRVVHVEFHEEAHQRDVAPSHCTVKHRAAVVGAGVYVRGALVRLLDTPGPVKRVCDCDMQRQLTTVVFGFEILALTRIHDSAVNSDGRSSCEVQWRLTVGVCQSEINSLTFQHCLHGLEDAVSHRNVHRSLVVIVECVHVDSRISHQIFRSSLGARPRRHVQRRVAVVIREIWIYLFFLQQSSHLVLAAIVRCQVERRLPTRGHPRVDVEVGVHVASSKHRVNRSAEDGDVVQHIAPNVIRDGDVDAWVAAEHTGVDVVRRCVPVRVLNIDLHKRIGKHV